ncbi:MAG: transcription antitermination protein NusB [Paludibacteraceae bacterium]|nr:transcription antitermination protein NusB [Paludibacteraceae bacterium]
MINRQLLRVKTVQTLYSAFVVNGASGAKMERQLIESVSQSGSLYYCMLQLMVDMCKYLRQAELHSHSEDDPQSDPLYTIMSCRKFRENAVSRFFAENDELKQELENRSIMWTWEMHREVMREIAISVSEKDYFQKYAADPEDSILQDVSLWCKIFENDVQSSPLLEDLIEEMSIYWNDDLQNAIAFVVKSIRRLRPDSVAQQPLVPVLRDASELEYAKRLLRYSLLHFAEADAMVKPLLKGWDLSRLSVMDLSIMRAAYAELKTNSETHAGIILNEYTEIAKGYCGDSNVPFISAVLYSLAKEIRPLEVKNKPTKQDNK